MSATCTTTNTDPTGDFGDMFWHGTCPQPPSDYSLAVNFIKKDDREKENETGELSRPNMAAK